MIEQFLATRLADEDGREGEALIERTSALAQWLVHIQASAENTRFRFEDAAAGTDHAAVHDLAAGRRQAGVTTPRTAK